MPENADVNLNPLNDDYESHKNSLEKASNPIEDDYEFFKDITERAEDPLDDDYIREEYRS